MSKEIAVACCHTVFTKEQRVEYKNTWYELEKRKLGVTEIENGYEYLFFGDSDTLRLLNDWVSLERKCCPFLNFTVSASHEETPILFQLTGNEEAKAFLRNEFNENINMLTLNEDIKMQ
ncbi:hypothetical protein [Cohnella sp.]|uniref:hypothetical protein n=1 Tax=Cohnella sp. TaxID=1883426 RepID=UPI0035695315